MKKCMAILLALVLALATLAGCTSPAGSNDSQETTTAADTTAKAEAETEKTEEAQAEDPFAGLPDAIEPGVNIKATQAMYPNIDFDKHETIHVFMNCDEPQDFQKVWSEVNKYFEENFNTTVEANLIPFFEWFEKFSLNMSAGVEMDLAFTAPWNNLWAEEAKGSWYHMNMDFINQNMPLSAKYEAPEAWNQVTRNGDILCVPKNATSLKANTVAVRKDLMDKYGIEDLKTWEDYKNYCLTIAEKETPESGILAITACERNGQMKSIFEQQYNLVTINDRMTEFYFPLGPEPPKPEELRFAYTSEEYREFLEEMRELGQAGCWSRSALTSSTRESDGFAALMGASCMGSAASIFDSVKTAEANEGVECAVYDLTADYAESDAYSNNCMGITVNSKNPERAAMVLDIMKNDTYVNHLIRFGIEGEHYEIIDGKYKALNGQTSYIRHCLSLANSIDNPDVDLSFADERQQKVYDQQMTKKMGKPTAAFVFDDSNCADEVAAVDVVWLEYLPSFELGLYEDIDAKIDEMMVKAKAAGLDKIENELRTQYEAWYNENYK